MRPFLRAVVVGCLFSPPAAAVDSRPIPQDPARQEQRFTDMLAWNRRTLAGAYDRVGKKDPRWDAAARVALDTAARNFSHSREPKSDLVSLHNAVGDTTIRGCDDPLILYLYARSSTGAYDPGPAERDRRYSAAAAAMADSAYPPFRRFTALYKAAAEKSKRKDATAATHQEAVRLVTAALRLLPASVAEDELTPDLEGQWYDLALEALVVRNRQTGDIKAAYDWVDAELAKTPALKALRLKTRGAFYKSYAWQARGNGVASTVTADGWKKFAERLQVARQALTEAWALRPDAQIATLMLWVEIGQGRGRAEMETWFERAMRADGNFRDACAAKLEWLSPKWHGSREELLAFGRACRDTGNVRMGIPLLVADAHYRVCQDLPNQEAKDRYMRSDEVWNDIFAVYPEYLKQNYTDHAARSRYAVLSYMCGRLTVSQRQFLLLGKNARGDTMFTEKYVLEVRDFVAKHAGESATPAPKRDATAAAPPADPRTRTFAAEKCRVKLPGPEWRWIDKPLSGVLCSAENGRGLILLVGSNPIPRTTPLDQTAAERLDWGMDVGTGGLFVKRSTGIVQWQGLASYQVAGQYPDGRTTISRTVFANGYGYHVMLIGEASPVENRPDCEAIMEAFGFTEPPLGHVGTSSSYSPWHGSWLIFLVVWAVFRGLRGKSSKSQRKPRPWRPDDEDDIPDAPLLAPPGSPGHAGLTVVRPPARRATDTLDEPRAECRTRTGTCQHCGYPYLPPQARECPHCGLDSPRPAVVSKYAGRGAILGIVLGFSGGATWGYLFLAGGGLPGVIGGVLLGTLAGIVVGLTGGTIVGFGVKLARMSRPD